MESCLNENDVRDFDWIATKLRQSSYLFAKNGQDSVNMVGIARAKG